MSPASIDPSPLSTVRGAAAERLAAGNERVVVTGAGGWLGLATLEMLAQLPLAWPSPSGWSVSAAGLGGLRCAAASGPINTALGDIADLPPALRPRSCYHNPS